MRFSLVDIIKRSRNIRRRRIVIRDIAPPAVLATDLFRNFYAPAVEAWSRAAEPIMDEYARTLAQMTQDSPADVGNTMAAAESEFQRLILLLTPELNRWAVRVESWVRGRWRGAILSATGIDLQTFIGPEDVRETVGAFIERNVALAKNIGAEAQGRISDSVFRGLTERKPAREVAKEIGEAVQMGRARARRIAADQMSKLATSLADERRREAGIDTWKWRHSGKLHPRLAHLARDGKVYADTKAGAGGDVLPPPEDRPGQLPFCGCRSQAVINLD